MLRQSDQQGECAAAQSDLVAVVVPRRLEAATAKPLELAAAPRRLGVAVAKPLALAVALR